MFGLFNSCFDYSQARHYICMYIYRLCLKECKGHSGSVPTYPISDDGSEFISPVGIIFLKSIKGTNIIFMYPSH